MKWAVEVQKFELEERNLSDLLSGLGFQLVDGVEYRAIYAPFFDRIESAQEVWEEAKKVRDAFTGPAQIDPSFVLGSVVEFSTEERRRHAFLEVKSGQLKMFSSSATLTISPPSNLTSEELEKWHREKAEREYQEQLEQQRKKLEPAFFEENAPNVLKLLSIPNQTGETLYKIYELMEHHPSNRDEFLGRFGVTRQEFRRFSDAVHNPVISGDLARHAYKEKPKTEDPMTFNEAKTFVENLANKWLLSVRSDS